MKLNIKVSGIDKVERKFKLINTAINDLQKPFDEITKDWMKQFDDNFSSEGRALKQPWRPRVRSYSWPILQKTGKLRGGFNRKIKKDSAEIANKVAWAKYHQFGTSRLPIRRIVDATKEMAKFAIDKIKDYINKAIKK